VSTATKIEWTRSDDGTAGASWNPVTGCTKVSAGCDHCYAETFAERWRGIPGHHFEHGFNVTLRPEWLDHPLLWRKPKRVFVNSMSDLSVGVKWSASESSQVGACQFVLHVRNTCRGHALSGSPEAGSTPASSGVSPWPGPLLPERLTGIEPALSAWEADVLPLNCSVKSLSRVVAGIGDNY
jgi:hypothetical protein